VRRKHHALLVDRGNALAHLAKHLPVLFRRGVAHRVGHIDGGGAGFDGDAHHLHQEIAVGAGRILGRKLHVVAPASAPGAPTRRKIQRLGAADLQLVFEVQVARRQKDMDARAIGKLQRPRRHLDVLGFCARQRRDARLANGLRNRGNGRKIALRGHGKAGLDDVHAQVFQGMGHGELFLRGHRATRRLLAVAQSGVEECYR
jgi:hypothetical protein